MRNPPLVLVVDDEDSFREIISARLKAAGYAVALAKNAEEGIKQTEALLPDLVLMDVYMPPGENGTGAAIAIKQNEKTRSIPIAFLTSLKDPWPGISGDNKNVAQELGMADFLEKTEDLDKVADRAREILQRVEQAP